MRRPLVVKVQIGGVTWTGRVSHDGFGGYQVDLRRGRVRSLSPDAYSCRWDTELQATAFLLEEMETRIKLHLTDVGGADGA